MQNVEPESWLPLQPRVYWILLVLADAPMHGYAILKETRDRSEADLRLGPTTLYRTLYRLVDDELVEPADVLDAEDERRQYYRLTRLGRAVLKAELARLERAVRLGRAAFRSPVRQGNR
jgi:DNA-binding PadR family transcriptional regulator